VKSIVATILIKPIFLRINCQTKLTNLLQFERVFMSCMEDWGLGFNGGTESGRPSPPIDADASQDK